MATRRGWKIGVTFRDLENLSVLLERQPISIAAAASLLSVQRAYLYRLIERINRIIGDPPPQWRHRKGIVLPVEVRRLVRAYRVFHDSRDDLVRFPRVSAGSRAALLLSLYLARTGYKAGRLMVVRSRDAVEALRKESVDAVRNMFDETFVRAWRLYLVGSIAAFLAGKLQLFQVLYARTGSKTVPWTRAHVYRDHA